jgi:multidrug efflux pump subunit AcrA (membrane-fusion protein)
MVQLVDVKPTVLDLLGMPQVPGLDGRSLLPVMKGQVPTHRDVVYLSECTWQAKRGIRTPDWKFIRCTDPGVYPRSEDELYDLRQDPEEQRNVALERPHIAADLNKKLTLWLDEQLQGRPDPMLRVVADGLPAVMRLDTIINGTEREAHQIPDHPPAEEPTAEHRVVGGVVAAGLPTQEMMTAGAQTPTPTAVVLAPVGGPPDTKRLNRRRAAFLSVVTILAILALIFAATSVFSSGVQAAGQLQPTQTVDLNFPTTAPVQTLWVQPGSTVHKGEVLATQDQAALNSKLQADQAKLAAAQTMLANGPTATQTPTQLSSQVAQAEAALTAAQTKAASEANLDALAVTTANNQVTAAQATLALDGQATAAACSSGTGGSTTSCADNEHQISADQLALTTAQGAYQTAIQTQRTDASNSQTAIGEAQAAVASAQADESAGTQPQNATEISSEQAAVNAAQADVAADQNAINQAQIRAPFTGIVANVSGSVGDLAGPNGIAQSTPQSGVSTPSSGITLFPNAPTTSSSKQPSQASFITLNSTTTTVEVQVGESDISGIHIGQRAQVTFPADSGAKFNARVTNIDPTAVNQSGKVYFLVDLGLVSAQGRPLPAPSRLKGLSGLSADVTFS